jgi:hypothetical protein
MRVTVIWFRRILQGSFVYAAIILVSLGVCEVGLRVRNPERLRASADIVRLLYRYDPELGWMPVPNSVGKFTASRTVDTRHNSLGLRDRELGNTQKRTIMFLGDSFVWGYDVEANERFTDILQRDLPKVRIVNVGVAGYGTDQEYLLMKRLWEHIKPQVVVLVYCEMNDHDDNSSNFRYGAYKPYYALSPHGGEFKGIPVPRSRSYVFVNNWLARNSWVARLLISLYFHFVHPVIHVPDPSERLIMMTRQFVEVHGAKFLVGITHSDPELEGFLSTQAIPHTTFADADRYRYPSNGTHWTPQGHALVASHLIAFLAENGILPSEGRP